ncbi:acetyl-CoA C-acetyltransferase [Klebsiella aerogenes]|uniref:acetyl-CoA C-acetyltransferase n=1 Tax=Klebsiella aerogenes TaxID=548 RepID=UPI0021D24421|nr:acetyl-CoA C-acetyltransferase [Klebsiella aerogenes]MCU6317010.1 acetyl-CoA C-acetyltransferase [Klebsiella aerogenes]
MLKDNAVYVIDLARTPIGSFMGSLSDVPASELGSIIIRKLISSNQINPSDIDEVIIGQVLTSGCGQNPARQAALRAGVPDSIPALTINKVCGSGIKALQLAYQAIKCGDADIIIAGGQENMSLSPHIVPLSRKGVRMGACSLEDSMIKDGLWDAFNDYHMGNTAENIAEKWKVSREEQDTFAALSQNKVSRAKSIHGFEEEIVPVQVKDKNPRFFCEDEFHRPESTYEKLSTLKPVFKKAGTVTAGNSSGVNDGAAMVLLMSGRKVKQLDISPLAVLHNIATAGVDPALMGTGPIPSSRLVLNKTGWNISDLDLIESNEAFAAQAIVVNREMGWDLEKVNVNGGAIALGHPIGASGARIFVSLVHEMKRRNLKKGLATLCIGGGMGIAATVELI